MKLLKINKARYRKHLNIVFVVIAICTLVLALGISTLLIQLFGGSGESHFYHNMAGAVIAVAIVFYTLHRLRHHDFLVEVTYVWDLKQQLNQIVRKQRKIEEALELGNVNAMIVTCFQLQGSKQLYELDDNTITLDELTAKIAQHDSRIEAAGLNVSADQYTSDMLAQF